MEQVQQRFERMDRIMNDAQKAEGVARQRLLVQHMQMMQEQMAEAHRLMTRMRGAGRMVPLQGTPMDQLQERLDIMQGIMAQMLKQQQMMLKSRER